MEYDEAAKWMLDQYNKNGFLYQEEASSYFLNNDHDGMIYYDGKGNLCLGKEVLKKFKKLTPNAVYERANKFWRTRLETDQPGRNQ